MAGIDDEFLDENPVVAERRLGFGLGETKPFGDFGSGMRDPHPLAAAAGRSLDHHGIADLLGDLHRVLCVLDHAEVARHRRDFCLRGGLFGLDLVAHRGDGARIGSDEDDPRRFKRARKRFAFGQETVTRMHGLRAGLAAGLDDLFHRQIALGRSRRSNEDRFIRYFDVKGVTVGLGIDRDRLYPHPAGSLDDPAGDLAPIRDQNSFEHAGLLATFGRGQGQSGTRRRT